MRTFLRHGERCPNCDGFRPFSYPRFVETPPRAERPELDNVCDSCGCRFEDEDGLFVRDF